MREENGSRNRGTTTSKRQIPLICVLVALVLFLVATRLYPGGTLDDPTVKGFDWSRNYLTQLFRPAALNGQPNSARPCAIAGMWLLCVGIAELFRQLAKDMAPSRHSKWVQISGIATTVYAALTVTRMHDLMLTISLGFLVAVDIVLLHWLGQRRQLPQWVAGMATLALLLITSFVYYRHVYYQQMVSLVLPALQKLVFLSSVCWLLWLHKSAAVEAPVVVNLGRQGTA